MEAHRRDLTAEGTPRKRKPWGSGADPSLTTRAPVSVLEVVRAKAAQRNVSVGSIVREALIRYVEGERAA
jgi:hypothetical protein